MLKENNWCKNIVTKEKVEKLLRAHYSFGWSYVAYYIPQGILQSTMVGTTSSTNSRNCKTNSKKNT
jgi:hypothetical protein